MSSHVHLVLQLSNDSLGHLMRKVNAPFGAWVNKRRGGLGTILADRPKSVLMHSDTYGMELIRYVHNNPVRAGVVSRASDSDWSSHRAYLGLVERPSWLATEAVLGTDETERESIRQELATYVDEGRNEGRRPEFSGEVPRTLARRIRQRLGGEVELSYPVLGPDDFVVSALKEQVARHRDKHRPYSINRSQHGSETDKAVECIARESAVRLDMGGPTGAVAGDGSGCDGGSPDRGQRDALEAEAGGVM